MIKRNTYISSMIKKLLLLQCLSMWKRLYYLLDAEIFGEEAYTSFFCNWILELVILISYVLSAVEVRKSLHLRLGLPFDRPLLRIANALDFSTLRDGVRSDPTRKGNLIFH